MKWWFVWIMKVIFIWSCLKILLKLMIVFNFWVVRLWRWMLSVYLLAWVLKFLIWIVWLMNLVVVGKCGLSWWKCCCSVLIIFCWMNWLIIWILNLLFGWKNFWRIMLVWLLWFFMISNFLIMLLEEWLRLNLVKFMIIKWLIVSMWICVRKGVNNSWWFMKISSGLLWIKSGLLIGLWWRWLRLRWCSLCKNSLIKLSVLRLNSLILLLWIFVFCWYYGLVRWFWRLKICLKVMVVWMCLIKWILSWIGVIVWFLWGKMGRVRLFWLRLLLMNWFWLGVNCNWAIMLKLVIMFRINLIVCMLSWWYWKLWKIMCLLKCVFSCGVFLVYLCLVERMWIRKYLYF